MARPTIDVDEEKVELLASYGCSVDEIATILDATPASVQRRANAALKKGRATLYANLRKLQIELAKKGNVAMQIWLGKQHLGQKEPTVGAGQGETATEPIKFVEAVPSLAVEAESAIVGGADVPTPMLPSGSPQIQGNDPPYEDEEAPDVGECLSEAEHEFLSDFSIGD